MSLTIDLAAVSIADVARVGGKNASLGEMIAELSVLGIRVPGGFATTAAAYWEFIDAGELRPVIETHLADAESSLARLEPASKAIRTAVMAADLPAALADEIDQRYADLGEQLGLEHPHVAVRSSATAEDLPTASFAGQQESFLHIHGPVELRHAVKRCFASLFTARAISYRRDLGFDHFDVALSVGVQQMVLSDEACSGVMFTIDTETGHPDIILVTAAYGLGENIVQGRVSPDEYLVHKNRLSAGFPALLWKRRGDKELRLVYDPKNARLSNLVVGEAERVRYALADAEVLELARWGAAIEAHYSSVHGRKTPMDIEWAKDSATGELFVVQARPETVVSQRQPHLLELFKLRETGEVLATGLAIGQAIGAGTARLISTPADMAEFRDGEVLVTQNTDPDWEPIMKRAGAIVTESGGRTSHAAIVARELGVPAVVGAARATSAIPAGELVTVNCAGGDAGEIYRGRLKYDVEHVDARDLPATRTKIMLNLAQPELALKMSRLPVDGIGLARMEFIFAGWVGVHPLAITRYGELDYETKRVIDTATAGYASREDYFVNRLSEGIATLAGAFWPRRVILRLSDFKSSEYASLKGGAQFEPDERNPMIGWRGASRYYHPDFADGFLLEVEAIRRARDDLGLDNLVVMVPFCRTPDEGRKVLDTMARGGMRRGDRGLEVYVMAEIPANILLADQFSEIFDGFSIGSNDLTQLILGLDRDSARTAALFDERNEAVKRACAMLIETAHEHGKPVGICGQAPSDYPEFARFLVEQGIDSLSLLPDAVIQTRTMVAEIEGGNGTT